MGKKIWLAFIAMLIVPNVGLAEPYYAYPGHQQPPPVSERHPGLVLRDGIEKLIAFLEGGGAAKQDKLVSFVDREIASYFDFVRMSQMSMGPRMRYMNVEQRAQAVKTLRGLFLDALVRQLANYEPGRVQYLRPRGNPYSNQMILGVQSYSRNGYLQQLDFYFYSGRDGWKVYDVAANGLRATSVYREYFARQARANRPDRPFSRR